MGKSDIRFNREGYQVTFKCNHCNKVVDLENSRYISEDMRLCNKCFRRWKVDFNKRKAQYELEEN